MSIKIIDEGEIRLTPAEHNRLHREWQKCCQFNVNPPTFEEFVRSQKRKEIPDQFSKSFAEIFGG